MSFGEAISAGFHNYITFSGRAGRSEYWFWLLFTVLAAIATELLDAAIFVNHGGFSPANAPLNTLVTLVLLPPTFAAAARRLHDTDRSGWWLLVAFTGIGILLLLYWQYQESTPDANRFGSEPPNGTQFNLI
ncbi:MAG: DUF805 domain-containing protein [Xanthobacteraceae bacterium]